MGFSDEDPNYHKYEDLCEKLNIIDLAANDAWKSYTEIKKRYSLEGEQLHWLGCALYVACRKSTLPTVGKSNANIQGNCVSLTKLLTLCNLPLIEFFGKSKAWADMSNMPKDFEARIDTLQKNFSVSYILFQKYQPIFTDIFKSPDDSNKPIRSRRHKIVACVPSQLFEFCWNLFICIKSGISALSDDLVTSCHLLLVVCDLMYCNALLANRKDLLNPDFSGLPVNFLNDDFVPPKSANCIVSLLCERYEAYAVDAMSIKEYSLKHYLTKLFQDKVLKGEPSNFSGLLEPIHFDANNKAVKRVYEQHILSIGELDERIFLEKDTLIGSLPRNLVNNPEEPLQSKNQLETMPNLAPPTPLTGRKYLKSKEIANANPTSIPTQSVIKLQSMLVGCEAEPSEIFMQIFENSSPDMKDFLEAKVRDFAKMFRDAYSPQLPEQVEKPPLDFGQKRAQSAQTLFYKILELVLTEEMAKKPNFDVSTLLKNESFLQCMFACCCEIVLYSYQNRDKTFPWILQSLNLEGYLFYKVIEVIVKVAVDQLTRDMVKHLNRIEEMILESLAWTSSSPLWQALESCDDGVPSYEEVALPGSFDLADSNNLGQPAVKKITHDRNSQNEVPQSPVSSASERFQSPNTIGGAKKNLLSPDSKGSQSVLKGNSTLLSRAANVATTSDQSRSDALKNGGIAINISAKPRRTGSLALFFRKFYYLTYTRMQMLCGSLQITEHDLKRKIWTLFEHSVKERTFLMKDRHLDQILMCSVYVTWKLTKVNIDGVFTEIMKCYRYQPQAQSHIYRSVLIRKLADNETEVNLDNEVSNSSEPPPTPSGMAATSRIYGSEERGDLIKFYNTVYVPEVKDLVKRLGLGETSPQSLTLSPLPKYKSMTCPSPVRRVTSSVITRVLDPKDIVASPTPQLQYYFNRSPAKDLETINKMVTSVDARKNIGKRLLEDETELSTSENEPSSKRVARKLENLIGERRIQNP